MLRPILAATAVFAAAFALACGENDSEPTPAATSTTVAQTEASPSATTTAVTPMVARDALPAVKLERVSSDLGALDRPIAMLELEPGWFVVILQDGFVLGFPKAGGTSKPVTHLDWTKETSRRGNEEGMLSIAADPEFATNRHVYLYYNTDGGTRQTVVSRFTATGSKESLKLDPATELRILTVPQPFSNHNGGTLLFGRDGMLYLGLGDGGSSGDPNSNGQDLTRDLLGSIIRIDVRAATKERPYRIPADNPFADAAGGRKPETWAFGLRNPWRMSFDREAPFGLWAGDVGQNAYEEIDLIQRGANYGWNAMEGNHCFKPERGCERPEFVPPVAEYGHGSGACSITGGYVYRGKAVAGLGGTYLFSDYCSGTLGAIADPYAAGGREITTVVKSGPGIASFAEDADGELYALGSDGRIYKLVPG